MIGHVMTKPRGQIVSPIAKQPMARSATVKFCWVLVRRVSIRSDPVAVVANLESLKAPKRLSTLIEGESLLNDGSAFVLFEILVVVVAGRSVTGKKGEHLLREAVVRAGLITAGLIFL